LIDEPASVFEIDECGVGFKKRGEFFLTQPTPYGILCTFMRSDPVKLVFVFVIFLSKISFASTRGVARFREEEWGQV
jgi:hypothetical protein